MSDVLEIPRVARRADGQIVLPRKRSETFKHWKGGEPVLLYGPHGDEGPIVACVVFHEERAVSTEALSSPEVTVMISAADPEVPHQGRVVGEYRACIELCDFWVTAWLTGFMARPQRKTR